MKKRCLAGLLTVALLLCCGCAGQAENQALTRVVFARGHGSTWGNQFRVDVCPTEVYYLHHFVDHQFEELANVPIDAERWAAIEEAVMALVPHLERYRQPLWEKLFPPKTVDGGVWWSLTLTWGEEEVIYLWPTCAEADALEALLEELAAELSAG